MRDEGRDEGEGAAPDGIAIVGMAGRFPGADGVDAFWRNLVAGVESIAQFRLDELEDRFGDAVHRAPNFVAAHSVLDDVDQFDADFFGMYAREAELTDPQHRVFLECAWQALEDGGCDPTRHDGPIGVFAGCSMNTYFLHHVCRDRQALEEFTSNFQLGCYPTLVGAGREFLATRVSYKLDLRGPSFTVQSACSTSLVAIAQACQSLQLYQCDAALAGGVSITFPQRRGYLHQEGGMASADGHCRAFDAEASGTVFGSGAGVVLLKRLADALADGDRIYGVIRGCGINNDGAGKIGFTAPSVDGQAGAIAMALAAADVPARSIGYVECHGTATPLGDPIEIAALSKVYGAETDARQFCAVGSAKSNIGHLDAAAGVTGLIKTALALHHGQLPPTLHYRQPNPQIDFAQSPFFVNAELRDWRRGDAPRRAAVSSLGVGGTNVHVVLEEAPHDGDWRAPQASALPQLLTLSARSDAALAAARARLAAHLQQHGDALDDVAWSLQTGRRRFEKRAFVVADERGEAIARLAEAAPAAGADAQQTPTVVFMFPGQGAQYPQMARELYEKLPAFAAEIDRCATLLEPLLGYDLRELLYPMQNTAEAAARLRATVAAQPALFAVEYALARLWISWGIRPDAMIGHSLGEFVAATLAGVLTLEDALTIVATRARLMQALPGGAMLAVRLPEAELRALLPAALSIAAVNGPNLCVVSGAGDAVAAFEIALEARGVVSRRLHTSHAFHSPAIDPIVAPLRETIAARPLGTPATRYISCVSGDWAQPDEAGSADYWARHAREPVRFADGIATLLDLPGPVLLLEVGPGQTLSTLALQAARGKLRALHSLPEADGAGGDLRQLVATLGELWAAGCDPDWAAVHGQRRRRVALPGYPFQRRRYWIDAPPAAAAAAAASVSASVADLPSVTPTATAALAAPESSAMTHEPLIRQLTDLLEELSGQSLDGYDAATSFLEMGFDSLFLTQVAQRVQSQFGVRVTFRQLLNEHPSRAALAALLAAQLPGTAAPPAPAPAAAAAGGAVPDSARLSSGEIESVFRDQLKAMSALIDRQLEALREQRPAGAPSPAPAAASAAAAAPAAPVADDAGAPLTETGASRFQVYTPAKRQAGGTISDAQRRHLDELVARCTARAAGSKASTQQFRPVLADPRAASGFRSEWKELVYPLVCTRAAGSKVWDADGNVYIDLVNGYGQTFFGHAPDFVVDAVKAQLDKGFAIGPQAELAGPVAALFAELTGNERVTFCNTGSEAVMAAMRLARAVTGRERVVIFGGDYHGQFDEVLVKGVRRAGGEPRPMPVASGIPAAAVSNMVVLEYGSDESLQWIRNHASELAAVIVEPVQSRHPALQPYEFLRELRRITEASGTAFVMDEVVTGFRAHPAGVQGLIGIHADLATYGKVVGGGLPIGILAGKARFMDALDGGAWRYGDDSFPETGVTFFAGTFVRHPLALAAAAAVLERIRAEGPQLQEMLGARTAGLVAELRRLFARYGVEATIEQFSSFFYFSVHGQHPLAPLLYHHLRLRGVLLQDGFPCFLTTAHSDDDLRQIVEAFRDSLAAMAEVGIFTPPQPDDGGTLPLTESQLEIWLAAQLGDEASCAFNESVTVRLDGALDGAALQRALDALMARHDALRLRFAPTGESQCVAPPAPMSCPLVDLSGGHPERAEARLDALIASDAATPFDLVDGPVIRAQLVRLGPQSHALLLSAHHIICDGWSINVLVDELRTLYAAAREGRDAGLAPAPQFADYARRERRREASALAATEAYWQAQFTPPPAVLELPTDRPRPALRRYEGATQTRHLDAAFAAAVKKAGARHGSTLFATLLAAFGALVGRLGGSRDVVVGVPTAGQSMVGEDALVGHCVNFLPLRVRWDERTTVAELLGGVSRSVLDAYEHQDYTLGTLVRGLALPRQANRLPLTEVQFNLERLAGTLQADGLTLNTAPNPKAYVNFDLFLNVIESPQGLRLDCDYNRGLYDAATIGRWLDSYAALLEGFVAGGERAVATLDWLPSQARRELLDAQQATAAPYAQALCVHQLIEAQARRRPQAPAVRGGEIEYSYAQLDALANRIAQHLRATLGGERGLIGVAVRRSALLPALLLGVWKAGCAYVPLDLGYPPARLRQILDEAGVLVLLTDTRDALDGLADDVPTIDLVQAAEAIAAAPAQAPALTADAGDLAYVIYTSGSTGTPKGVEITHRSVVNFLTSMARMPGLHEDDRLFATTTIAFDIAALELFLPLSVGACTIVADADDLADGFQMLARLRAARANVMQATPSGWRLLLEAGFESAPGFRMLCGGEPLTRELADRLLAGGGRLWNLYGPTETTIWSSCTEVLADGAPISVGKPIANTQFYILDAHGQALPAGVPGELCIGGDGVARGYHRRPELTAERFIANPFGEGRLYRTGDLAQRLADGDTLVFGRLDQQVKLRGFRIELGEIETALARQPGVAAAAVALRDDDGAPALVAFYVAAAGADPDPASLRETLAAQLPGYMVPTRWQRVDALPLTPNGKLDRQRLVAAPLGAAAAAPAAAPQAPGTATETRLLAIWREVLGRDAIGIDTDLLSLGADSIQLFQIVARAAPGSCARRPRPAAPAHGAPARRAARCAGRSRGGGRCLSAARRRHRGGRRCGGGAGDDRRPPGAPPRPDPPVPRHRRRAARAARRRSLRARMAADRAARQRPAAGAAGNGRRWPARARTPQRHRRIPHEFRRRDAVRAHLAAEPAGRRPARLARLAGAAGARTSRPRRQARRCGRARRSSRGLSHAPSGPRGGSGDPPSRRCRRKPTRRRRRGGSARSFVRCPARGCRPAGACRRSGAAKSSMF
ncbi:non-ribosomal peptide synthetase/type I polyketide synthase [Solimonas variicoloris]|uniref:non-ribosomal peptide synthetase/type I polyketide synthase n=1 Tax=Solimonas variicoloris TaxID=254408 RepID=UPI00146E8226|nr:non-ribosomal peptide synthetase/type I polyketide synthase [Solimonas variicoloris]